MKIHKNDMVKVITGKEKGKTGRVISIDREKGRVLVERVNMVKRHQKPTQQYRQGGIIDKEAPIQISNVMYYDEKAGRASRIGAKIVDGRKVRVAKATGEVIAVAVK
ncbi:MAG: 50S ribosomal protein L24 [Pseudomonadota bacterium]